MYNLLLFSMYIDVEHENHSSKKNFLSSTAHFSATVRVFPLDDFLKRYLQYHLDYRRNYSLNIWTVSCFLHGNQYLYYLPSNMIVTYSLRHSNRKRTIVFLYHEKHKINLLFRYNIIPRVVNVPFSSRKFYQNSISQEYNSTVPVLMLSSKYSARCFIF